MNANLMTKKIEMSKSEAKEAGKLNTEKFHELRQFMAAYPGYEVQIKAPGRHKVELRGLDYKYMREYIQKHDDEQHSKMEKFKTLIAQDKKDKVEGAEHLDAAGYGVDPQDRNIRIAPSLPSVEDLEKAMEIFCTCLKLAALEKLRADM